MYNNKEYKLKKTSKPLYKTIWHIKKNFHISSEPSIFSLFFFLLFFFFFFVVCRTGYFCVCMCVCVCIYIYVKKILEKKSLLSPLLPSPLYHKKPFFLLFFLLFPPVYVRTYIKYIHTYIQNHKHIHTKFSIFFFLLFFKNFYFILLLLLLLLGRFPRALIIS